CRAAIGADAADEFADLLRQDRVEVGGRLVVEDQLGVDRQRAGDRHALAHPARELARQLRLRALELHVGEDAVNDRLDLRGAVAPVLPQPQAHVLGDGERGEQGPVLEDHGDAERLLLGRDREVAGELETADRDPAGIGTLEADDLAEQHRLPRAALADDREQLAGVDRQIDAAEDLGAAVRAPHAAEVERHAPALRLLRSAGHQSTAKLPRTIRKSKTRIRMKLHTTADVVAVAIPSVPPRVRSPNAHGTTDAIMPNISPFTRSEEHTSELQSRFDLVCR